MLFWCLFKMPTINVGDKAKQSIWHENISRDNLGKIVRKMEPVLRKSVLPKLRTKYRQVKLPSGLDNQELKYLERVLLAKSMYKYSILVEQMRGYASIKDIPIWEDRIQNFSNPYKSSTDYKFNGNLERNRISLKRNGGLPTLTSKRDSFDGARQWNDQRVKPNPIIENCYGIEVGYRTQQPSAEGEFKVRGIHMIPTHMWILQSEAFDSAITNTINSVSTKHEILVLYIDPLMIREWMNNFNSEVRCWLNVDSEKFDQGVTPSENKQTVNIFAPEYEFKELLVEYSNRADIILPSEIILRNGGKSSGEKTTNLDDGYDNIQDLLEVLDKMHLIQYVVCILVNGDDITIGLSTQFTEKNLIKLSELSRRTINPDKSIVSNHIWNSKWYVDEDIQTRPVFRVLNSLMYSERRKESIYGSKEMIEIINSMILKDVEQHPIGPDLIRMVASASKIHISTMSDEQIAEAVEYFIEDQSWRQIDSVSEMTSKIRSTEYAQARV